MTERSHPRRPATFRLDDPSVVVVDADEVTRPARGTIQITPEAEPALLPVPIEPQVVERRGLRWGTVFWSGVAGLTLLGLGLGIAQLIENLFVRSEALGVLGLGLSAAAALALAVITAREARALMRLAEIETLHRRAAAVLLSDDRTESRAILRDLLKIAQHGPGRNIFLIDFRYEK